MSKNPIQQATKAVSDLEDRTRETVDAFRTRGRQTADRVQAAGRNVWLAGLGAFATASERAGQVVDQLAQRGDTKGRARLDRLAAPVRAAGDRVQTLGHKVERQVESQVTTTLERLGVPSRREITSLIGQVEALNQKIDRLATKA